FLLLAAAVDDVQREGSIRALVPRWLLGAATAAAVFPPQLLAWKAVYGGFLALPQGPGFMVWDAPAWSQVLFSARNGLFAWAPLCAIAAGGLVVAAGRAPRRPGACLLA